MIYVLNNLIKEYDLTLNEHENCPTSSEDDMLTTEVIYKKLNHWCEKIKLKMKKKERKKKTLGAYNKYQQRCH